MLPSYVQELDDSLSDCREIDSVVSGSGDPERRKQLEAELASRVQALRSKSGQLTEALQSASNKRGGYVTFQVSNQTTLYRRCYVDPGDILCPACVNAS
jgi:hypothetical protein